MTWVDLGNESSWLQIISEHYCSVSFALLSCIQLHPSSYCCCTLPTKQLLQVKLRDCRDLAHSTTAPPQSGGRYTTGIIDLNSRAQRPPTTASMAADTASAGSNMTCPDPSAHQHTHGKGNLSEAASTAALLAANNHKGDSKDAQQQSVLDADGKLSSRSECKTNLTS
jgi:hypothetical protein